ncbi:hypothetical protein GCM10009603_38550 [Nocardiopsis exhalans]
MHDLHMGPAVMASDAAVGAWIEWVFYTLGVVHDLAVSTTRRIGAIRRCQEDIAERARTATPGGRDVRFADAASDRGGNGLVVQVGVQFQEAQQPLAHVGPVG